MEVYTIESYKKELENQLLEIQELIKKSNRNMARYKDLPDSHVYISNSNGCAQYYLKAENKPRKYIHKKDIRNVAKYAQRDYEYDMNKHLIMLEKKLSKFLNWYDIERIKEYDKYSPAKRALIKPLVPSDYEFIGAWKKEYPGQRNPFPEEGLYQTNRGEMVRSKSEKIIADALEKYGVPYQYEPLLELGYNTVYPDFVVLNLRTRKTLYWEHLGIVSDMEYATKNFKKLQNYERNGFLLGRDLITTMESADLPIDIKLVEQKIKEFLL